MVTMETCFSFGRDYTSPKIQKGKLFAFTTADDFPFLDFRMSKTNNTTRPGGAPRTTRNTSQTSLPGATPLTECSPHVLLQRIAWLEARNLEFSLRDDEQRREIDQLRSESTKRRSDA